MDTCCPPENSGPSRLVIQGPSQDKPAVCPQCGQKGKTVPGQTVKANLSVSLRKVENTAYFFCRTETCPVVYFTKGGESIFTTRQLRERVFQKEPESEDVKVCYCFGHTGGEIRGGTPEAKKAIVSDINAGIAAGQCACDLRNPQGTCCLGNVMKLVSAAGATLHQDE